MVTAVFQWGWLAGLIGVDRTGPIQAFLPVIVFAILFGLSMDYEVLLVSRIYEEWHRRRDNTAAVVHGLAATGRTITAAAAVMVLVFAAFILGGEHVIKLFGVGPASAVLLDALIVRSVLIPGLMLTVGSTNWKLPSFLDRMLPVSTSKGKATARHLAPPTRRPLPASRSRCPPAGDRARLAPSSALMREKHGPGVIVRRHVSPGSAGPAAVARSLSRAGASARRLRGFAGRVRRSLRSVRGLVSRAGSRAAGSG